MRIFEIIKHILYADSFVSRYKADDEHRNQRGIAVIAAAAFAVMSLLNVKQKSYAMLATTSISAIFLVLGYLVSRYKNNSSFLRVIFYIIFVAVFTSYTVMGGNDGFAALWLVTATYAVMIAIDFKAGFIISVYNLVMLLMLFVGPLSPLLQYAYNPTFLLRFPVLYGINFAFATYIVVRIRLYQYELLMKQEELEHISSVDLSTGLWNRNRFVQYEQAFPCKCLQSLIAVFIDVNGLHEVNNRDGHDAGDRMLYTIAQLCKKHFPHQPIFRMGGDEFLVLCEDAVESDATATAQRLLDNVEQEGYSISYGIELQACNFNLSEIIKSADAKMISYKSNYYRCANQVTRQRL